MEPPEDLLRSDLANGDSSMRRVISGAWAAAITPRRADGTVDEPAFAGFLEALIERGIRGFVVNGATGEFCLTNSEELRRLLAVAAQVTRGRAEFACCIGSAGMRGCLDNGTVAMEAGAKALLLPMPYFFPYQQDDLDAFCRGVARDLRAPILLYNLPSFTTPLEASTVQRLIEDCPDIVGIKDSSGSLEILRSLTRAGIEACRIVGNDSILAQAIEEGVCDGVISGVAAAMPELIVACWKRQPEAARRLDEFIKQIAEFPVPWGVKLVAGFRGFAPAHLAQPMSQRRAAQTLELKEWVQRYGKSEKALP